MLQLALQGLLAALLLMAVIWVLSVYVRDVSIVDMVWGPAVVLPAVGYAQSGLTGRGLLVLVLAGLWALRLFFYILKRNYGRPEDRRYADMRRRNDPGFWWKSLYLVFGLQAVLAWVIGMPLFGAVASDAPLGVLDWVGAAVFCTGLAWEAIADTQLAGFLANRGADDAVMDRGLWRYSRHPNYFGEFTLWWGMYLIALSAGAWWTLIGPALLTFFLFKVSGVSLLEKDISGRRPAYQAYVRRTSAFFPRRPQD